MILSRQRMAVGAATLVVCCLLNNSLAPTLSGQDALGLIAVKKSPDGRAVGSDPNAVVLFPIRTGNAQDILNVLNEQFRGKVDVILLLEKESPPKLIVKAAPEIQAEVRGVINFLDNEVRRGPTTSVKPPAPVNVGPNRISGQAAPATATIYTPSASAATPLIAGRTGGLALIQGERVQQPRIEAALKKLRDAKSDDDKAAAKEGLHKVLATVFEEDMAAREKQAKEIESRLTKLRNQYEERRKAASEILNLQLKALENEAAGLGFPSGGPTTALPAIPGPSIPGLPEPDMRPFEQFIKGYPVQERIGQLIKEGHFISSSDGKMYAYLELTSATTSTGNMEIRVCDAAIGKLMAAAKVASPVGRLQFTDEGVATREPDGAIIVRVPLRKTTTSGPRR